MPLFARVSAASLAKFTMRPNATMVTSSPSRVTFGLAERDGVGLVRHLALHVVHRLVLEEDHRVVVADRLDQQPLGVVGVGRQRRTFSPGMWVKIG